jgi:hypothetical protein
MCVAQFSESPIVIVQIPPPSNRIVSSTIVGAGSVVESMSPPIVTKRPVTVEVEIGPGLITVELVNKGLCVITDVLLRVVGLVTRDAIEGEEVFRGPEPEAAGTRAELDYYELSLNLEERSHTNP